MGYGINLLSKPQLFLLDGLKGEYAHHHIETMRRTDEATLELCRISHYTFIFMNECKTLFKYCEEDDEDEDCWDRVYTWKRKYEDMEWEDLELIIKPLIETFASTNEDGFDENEKIECLQTLKILFDVIDIASSFQIY
jgi:L-rhamnose mutarotase